MQSNTRGLRDLISVRTQIAARECSAIDLLDDALACAADPAVAPAFLFLDAAAARVAASSADVAVRSDRPCPALGGLAISIKDLFDVQGQTTTAGTRVLRDEPAATADAPAVARLRKHGAALIGRTHMTEFAYSGVGLNPHHPTPVNLAARRVEPDGPDRIPGGSSSGAAASVTGGTAWAALGSDTGGSIRIPAALQGLVGFKNTAALTPTDGAVPLSTTLDTVCAITRSVRDAILVHEVLAERRVQRRHRPLKDLRVAVPSTVMTEALDRHVAHSFDAALQCLSRAGVALRPMALPVLGDTAAMLRDGGLPAAEAWATHRQRILAPGANCDPRVVSRMRRAADMSAADYLDLHRARRAWIARMHAGLHGFDLVVSPTVPIVAPPIAELEFDDEAFTRANALLLRNPMLVNLLDGCAISLPCQSPGSLPVGLMLWARGGEDDHLLDAAEAVESLLRAAQPTS